MSTNLSFNLAGRALGLLETPVKSKPERKWHCFRLPNGEAKWGGESIPALADELPKTITVDGQEITLVHGLSPATKRDKVSGEMVDIPEDERYPQAKYSGVHTLPSLKGYDSEADQGIRQITVTLSSTNKGTTWNVKVSVNRTSSVSPEDKTAKATKRAADNLAAIMAAFDAAEDVA